MTTFTLALLSIGILIWFLRHDPHNDRKYQHYYTEMENSGHLHLPYPSAPPQPPYFPPPPNAYPYYGPPPSHFYQSPPYYRPNYDEQPSIIWLLILGLIGVYIWFAIGQNQLKEQSNEVIMTKAEAPETHSLPAYKEKIESFDYSLPMDESNVGKTGKEALNRHLYRDENSIVEEVWVVLLNNYQNEVDAYRLSDIFSQRAIEVIKMSNGEYWACICCENRKTALLEVEDWKRHRKDWAYLKLSPQITNIRFAQ